MPLIINRMGLVSSHARKFSTKSSEIKLYVMTLLQFALEEIV